nr:uncharacterized protein LOC110147194 [Odocoileus virginianus texanus]
MRFPKAEALPSFIISRQAGSLMNQPIELLSRGLSDPNLRLSQPRIRDPETLPPLVEDVAGLPGSRPRPEVRGAAAIPCPTDRRNPASPRWPRSFGRCALAQGGSRRPPPFGALPAPAAPGKPARKRPLGRGEGKSLGFSLEPWASRARRAAPAEKGQVPALSPSAPPAAGRPFDVPGPAGMRPGYQSPSWIPKVSA